MFLKSNFEIFHVKLLLFERVVFDSTVPYKLELRAHVVCTGFRLLYELEPFMNARS